MKLIEELRLLGKPRLHIVVLWGKKKKKNTKGCETGKKKKENVLSGMFAAVISYSVTEFNSVLPDVT